MMEKLYSVGELARDLKVTTRAIRFYEDKGLIAPKRAGVARIYDNRDRGRLILILRGKRLGFSLREIAEWLDLYDSDHDHVEQTKLLLRKVHQRIEKLRRQQEDISATLRELEEIEREGEAYIERQVTKARGDV